MKKGVFAVVAGVLAALVSGCVTAVHPITAVDKGKWSEEKALSLINDSVDTKEHLGLSGSLRGSKEILSQVDHLADTSGLTAIRQTGHNSRRNGDMYVSTTTYMPYHIPFSDIEKVETHRFSFFFGTWVMLGLVNPMVISGARVYVTTTDGEKKCYKIKNTWDPFPYWICKPFYACGGLSEMLSDVGQAFLYLHQVLPAPAQGTSG